MSAAHATLLRVAAGAGLVLGSGCDARALNGGSALDGGTVQAAPFGPITSIATQQHAPWSIAVDGNEIFWLNQHEVGGIYKAPTSGGATVALTEGDFSKVGTFAVDGSSVYFPQKDGIYAVPRKGGTVRQIVSGTIVGAIVVANGSLYWEEAPAGGGDAVVKKAPTAGGDVTIVPLPPEVGTAPSEIIAASSDAVYASVSPDKLARIPLAGGAVTTVLDVPPALHALAFDADTIYLAAEQAVSAMPMTGGPSQVLATGTSFAGVAVDDAFVYAADDTDDGRILRIPKHGGAPSVVAAHQRGPKAVAVDGMNLYWNCVTEGAVKWAAKTL